jgi:tetratricopeptide (TPR) repeat protein
LKSGNIPKGFKCSLYNKIVFNEKLENSSAGEHSSYSNCNGKQKDPAVASSTTPTVKQKSSPSSSAFNNKKAVEQPKNKNLSTTSPTTKPPSPSPSPQPQPQPPPTCSPSFPSSLTPAEHSIALGNPNAAIATAINFVNQAQHSKAINLLNLILSYHTHFPGGYAARGTAYALTGRLDKAIEDFTTAIQQEPGYYDCYQRRGQALGAMNKVRGAISDYEKMIQLIPTDENNNNSASGIMLKIGAYVDLGRLHNRIKDHKKAEQAFRTALSLMNSSNGDAPLVITNSSNDGKKIETLKGLALALMSQGDLADAATTYHQALAIEPNNAEIALSCGMVYKEKSDVEDATKMLLKAAHLALQQQQPNNYSSNGGQGWVSTAVHAYRLLAIMTFGRGDHLGAVTYLDTALDIITTNRTNIENTRQPNDDNGNAENSNDGTLSGLAIVGLKMELTYLRGASHHARGMIKEATADFLNVLEMQPELEAESTKTNPHNSSANRGVIKEALQFYCLSFYQKEIAIYTQMHLDDPVDEFCLDGDFHPEFKELWCKKTPPSNEFVAKYKTILEHQARQQMMLHNNNNNNSNTQQHSPPPLAYSAVDPDVLIAIEELNTVADAIGKLMQYSHQGFLNNVRQQRAAGLAAIELAQMFLLLSSSSSRKKKTIEIPDCGASSCVTRSNDVVLGGVKPGIPDSFHSPGWRDLMDIVVKWRQLSEPADQVIWVDLLSEKEFSEGFGSHTPMYTGQTKCVRYYMNMKRALEVAKEIILREGKVFDAKDREVGVVKEEVREEVRDASSPEELWKAVGCDFWVVVPVHSSTPALDDDDSGTNVLEGTRLTLVKMTSNNSTNYDDEGTGDGTGAGTITKKMLQMMGKYDDSNDDNDNDTEQPDAYEFSIRTPVTPLRWQKFSDELEYLYTKLIKSLNNSNDDDDDEAVYWAMRFAHCWYNFMPLARGSAFCGFVFLHAAFLAVGRPIRSAPPPDVQTDWEAILEGRAERFIGAVSGWMVGGGGRGGVSCGEVGDMPLVKDVLKTLRHRLLALNG